MKRNFVKAIFLSVFVFSFIALTSSRVQAVGELIDPSTLPGTNLTLETLFGKLFDIFIWVISVAAFAGIVYSGFMYITAGGDTGKVELARKNLTWSIIGILLAICSYVIVTFVADWANVDTTSTGTTNSKSEATSGTDVVGSTPDGTTAGGATTSLGPIDDIAP